MSLKGRGPAKGSFHVATAVAALLLLLTGCGEGPDRSRVSKAVSFVGDLAVQIVRSLRTSFPEKPPPSEGGLEVSEVPLVRVPDELSLDEIAISPNQRRVAFKIPLGEGWTVVVDGREGPLYDEVPGWRPTFSPDSRRIAYAAVRDGRQYVVFDGVESAGYDPWRSMYPIFSPDSKRIAFMARRGAEVFLVIDGEEEKAYRDLRTQPPPTLFSPDSKRYAYTAELPSGKWVTVVDGVEGNPYDHAWESVFSPDSRRVIFAARRGEEYFLVDDGVESRPFRDLSSRIYVSPDSRRVACINRPETLRSSLVIDGVEGKDYPTIDIRRSVFSPDSQHTAYSVTHQNDLERKAKEFVVIDGREGPHYDRLVWYPVFSPDGTRVAYAAYGERKEFVVVDGEEGSGYSGVTRPVFSPDSRRAAYAARGKGYWTVVVDGEEGIRHGLGEFWRTEIFFSPDSRRVAYRASRGRSLEFVVVDGVQSIRYQLVEPGSPVFSPDSTHVAYWAAPSGRGWRIFVDRSYTRTYSEPLHNSKLVFDGPNHLHGLALEKGEIIQVEVRILQ